MIRKATELDIDNILPLFEQAKAFMRRNGNPSQWGPGYPPEEIIARDIRNGNFYVEEFEGEITGGFAFIIGPEPTYAEIDGRWPNDETYGTIHRLVSNGKHPGFADRCIAFCREQNPVMRADTHHDNKIVQRALERNGFRYCGVIRVADGSPRMAYASGAQEQAKG